MDQQTLTAEPTPADTPTETADPTANSTAAAATQAKTAAPSRGIRLNVNMNRETAAALRDIAERHDSSITEAVRRAVALADFIEREVEANNIVQVVDPRTNVIRELVLA